MDNKEGWLYPGFSSYFRVRAVTTTYTLTPRDEVVLGDATSGAFTITLPSANKKGRMVHIKRINSAANNVTISRAGSDTIETLTTIALAAQYASRTLVADGGTTWYIVAST